MPRRLLPEHETGLRKILEEDLQIPWKERKEAHKKRKDEILERFPPNMRNLGETYIEKQFLVEAAKQGDFSAVWDILKRENCHGWVDERPSGRRYGIIHQAVYSAKLSDVQKLVEEFFADPRKKTKDGKSVVEVAVERRDGKDGPVSEHQKAELTEIAAYLKEKIEERDKEIIVQDEKGSQLCRGVKFSPPCHRDVAKGRPWCVICLSQHELADPCKTPDCKHPATTRGLCERCKWKCEKCPHGDVRMENLRLGYCEECAPPKGGGGVAPAKKSGQYPAQCTHANCTNPTWNYDDDGKVCYLHHVPTLCRTPLCGQHVKQSSDAPPGRCESCMKFFEEKVPLCQRCKEFPTWDGAMVEYRRHPELVNPDKKLDGVFTSFEGMREALISKRMRQGWKPESEEAMREQWEGLRSDEVFPDKPGTVCLQCYHDESKEQPGVYLCAATLCGTVAFGNNKNDCCRLYCRDAPTCNTSWCKGVVWNAKRDEGRWTAEPGGYCSKCNFTVCPVKGCQRWANDGRYCNVKDCIKDRLGFEPANPIQKISLDSTITERKKFLSICHQFYKQWEPMKWTTGADYSPREGDMTHLAEAPPIAAVYSLDFWDARPDYQRAKDALCVRVWSEFGANETRRFHGTRLICGFRDGRPCDNLKCTACLIIKSRRFKLFKAGQNTSAEALAMTGGEGLYFTASAHGAKAYGGIFRNFQKDPNNRWAQHVSENCVIVTLVLVGSNPKKQTVGRFTSSLAQWKPPNIHRHSSFIVDKTSGGADETIIYFEDQALPRYLIVFGEGGVHKNHPDILREMKAQGRWLVVDTKGLQVNETQACSSQEKKWLDKHTYVYVAEFALDGETVRARIDHPCPGWISLSRKGEPDYAIKAKLVYLPKKIGDRPVLQQLVWTVIDEDGPEQINKILEKQRDKVRNQDAESITNFLEKEKEKGLLRYRKSKSLDDVADVVALRGQVVEVHDESDPDWVVCYTPKAICKRPQCGMPSWSGKPGDFCCRKCSGKGEVADLPVPAPEFLYLPRKIAGRPVLQKRTDIWKVSDEDEPTKLRPYTEEQKAKGILLYRNSKCLDDVGEAYRALRGQVVKGSDEGDWIACYQKDQAETSLFRVIYDGEKGLPVTETARRDSDETDRLVKHAVVEVVEEAPEIDQRVRARIKYPALKEPQEQNEGWITKCMVNGSRDFIEPLAKAAAEKAAAEKATREAAERAMAEKAS